MHIFLQPLDEITWHHQYIIRVIFSELCPFKYMFIWLKYFRYIWEILPIPVYRSAHSNIDANTHSWSPIQYISTHWHTLSPMKHTSTLTFARAHAHSIVIRVLKPTGWCAKQTENQSELSMLSQWQLLIPEPIGALTAVRWTKNCEHKPSF